MAGHYCTGDNCGCWDSRIAAAEIDRVFRDNETDDHMADRYADKEARW